MNGFTYFNPVRIHFGPGVIAELGASLEPQEKKVCLVSYKDQSSIENILNNIERLLTDKGVELYPFYEIEDNPDTTTIDRGVAYCRKHKVDLVIGIGGGSSMDAAKAIAAGVFYEGSAWDMVYSRHDNVTTVPPVHALPIIQIPTLPATGSEMNQCAVLSHREIQEKSYIWSECLYARSAFIDPSLTVDLPAALTANAAADAFSHVLEIYINGETDSSLPHYFQEGVMRTLMENVEVAMANPGDIDARTNLQWAATCAINGWSSPGDAWTPIHQVAHNLTSLFGIAHGPSLGALMPGWMKAFSGRRPESYYRFATRVMDIPASEDVDGVIEAGIEKFEKFLSKIHVATSLADVGVRYSDLDKIIAGVERISFSADGVLPCTPVVTQSDLKEMLLLARPKQ